MQRYAQQPVYCQSSPILLQFMLDAFLTAAAEVSKIRQVYASLEAAIVRRRPLREIERLLSKVAASLATLNGTSRIHARIYPWTPSKGALEKLKHYSSLFSPQDPRIDPSVSELTVSISKAYHGALEAREVLWQLRTGPILLHKATSLFRLLNRVMTNLDSASNLFPKIVLHYSDNENILYFHLLRREELDALYNRDYVRELFHEMFAGGTAEIKEHLLQRYKERGFDHLLASIEAQVDAL